MSVSLLAHAKLNVFLRVLGRREDGYHEIESLILPLSLVDVVTVEASEALTVVVRGDEHLIAGVPPGEDNVALVAARTLAAQAGPEGRFGARVTIDKRIPVAAGLGGGSADAAAVLRGLNELWGLGLDGPALAAAGAQVGSDVPALLRGGAVFVAGRGDHVESVHAVPTTWVIVAFDFGVRSPDAYAWWDEDPRTGPDPGALIAGFETGNDALVGSIAFDDLQPGVVARHPEIAETIDAFHAAGALGAVMSGSGPTVVALARHLGHADTIAKAIRGSFIVSGPPAHAPDGDNRTQSGVV